VRGSAVDRGGEYATAQGGDEGGTHVTAQGGDEGGTHVTAQGGDEGGTHVTAQGIAEVRMLAGRPARDDSERQATTSQTLTNPRHAICPKTPRLKI